VTYSQKIIKNKLGVLELARHLGNVSQACKVMGFSRDTFYRYKELYEEGGEEALQEISRKKPNLINRVPEEVENAVLALSLENPALGQVRASNELRKIGQSISPGGVRSVWLRHGVQTFKLRLKRLEEKMAREKMILTETQVAALERKKEVDEAHGQIETEHSGYLGSQDTYYVGTIKGIGRIYQQTFVDTYSRVAFCKLYDRKNALVAADALNDRVLPFFEEHKIPLMRILTDRGSEFKGRVEHHEYELYLALEEIDHTKTKARHPQTNGICERFHKTVKEEFYDITFRKKIYTLLDDLQADLDEWLRYYNEDRTHSGPRCNGRTPMQTWREGVSLAREKLVDELRRTESGANVAVSPSLV